jgi:rubrerythrin
MQEGVGVMDLSKFGLEDVVLSAIRSEMDAIAVYSKLAEGVKNAYLKDRLRFLAGEEERHRSYLVELYGKRFGGPPKAIPEQTPVPMPALTAPKEHVPISIVLGSAMGAEKAASEFYESMAELFKSDMEVSGMLAYFSKMEMGHYRLLETEKSMVERQEAHDAMWPMMHAGP